MDMAAGIGSNSDNFNYVQTLTPYRSHLLLQMLLQSNCYISFIWSGSYLMHMLIWSAQLWNYKGLAMLLAYVLAVGAESLRLYAGYSINLCRGASSMWLLLTLTPCVLLPTLVYLRLAAKTGNAWLHFISNMQLLWIALEALVTLFYHALSKPQDVKHNQPEQQTKLKSMQLLG